MLKTCNPLETVALLSGSNILDIDTNQSSRYCIKLNSVGGKEAYYFTTPIYNTHSRKLVRRKFFEDHGVYRFVGSNCEVSVTSEQIKLIRESQICVLNLKNNFHWVLRDGVLISDRISIIPTYNGICIYGDILQMSLDVSVDFDYQKIRCHQSCISFMESQFTPVFVVSGLFAQSSANECIPLRVKYYERSPKEGVLSFASNQSTYNQCAFEMNFYEPKLIQDTPVSGNFPNENNAFGPIAFVGKGDYYGTQWLYSRLDISKIQELQGKPIREIKLYIPRFTKETTPLHIFELLNRFCSFGSTWSKKVDKGSHYDPIKFNGDYVCIDLTRNYTGRGLIRQSSGVVITPANTGLGYQVISTGDSYVLPPILCVKYSNIQN